MRAGARPTDSGLDGPRALGPRAAAEKEHRSPRGFETAPPRDLAGGSRGAGRARARVAPRLGQGWCAGPGGPRPRPAAPPPRRGATAPPGAPARPWAGSARGTARGEGRARARRASGGVDGPRARDGRGGGGAPRAGGGRVGGGAHLLLLGLAHDFCRGVSPRRHTPPPGGRAGGGAGRQKPEGGGRSGPGRRQESSRARPAPNHLLNTRRETAATSPHGVRTWHRGATSPPWPVQIHGESGRGRRRAAETREGGGRPGPWRRLGSSRARPAPNTRRETAAFTPGCGARCGATSPPWPVLSSLL